MRATDLRRPHCLPVAAMLVCVACVGPTSDPMNPRAGVIQEKLATLDTEIAVLDQKLGAYPPRIDSDAEREETMKQWSAAVNRATALSNAYPDNAEVLLRAGNLFRQGHNLHIEGAAVLADRSFQKCLALQPNHVECHYSLARLYIASDPRFAPSAETHLLAAKNLIAPHVRPEIEQGLAFAYFAQGKNVEALHQLDLYIQLRPDDEEAKLLRDAIASGKAELRAVQ